MSAQVVAPRRVRRPHVARAALWLFGASAVAAIAVGMVTFGSALESHLYTAVIVVSGAMAVLGAVRSPADDGWRRARRLLAAGTALSAAGDATYAVYGALGQEPQVSWADVAWMSGYVGVGGAVLLLVLGSVGASTGAARRFRLESLLDLVTIVVVTVLGLWMFSVSGIVADASLTPWVRGVLATYPVLDAVLLALVLRLLVSARADSRFTLLVASGVLAWLVADLSYVALPYDGVAGRAMDLGWMAGPALLALACWTPVVRAPVARSQGGALARVTLAIGPLLVPPALEAVSDARGDHDFRPVALVGMACLVATAFARTLVLLRSEAEAQRLLAASRQRASRLAEVSSDAVVLVAPDGRVVEGRGRIESLVARIGTSSPPALAPDDVGWIDLIGAADRSALGDAFEEVLRRPGDSLTTRVELPDAPDPRWLDVRLVNLCQDPAVQGVVVALSDCTTTKRAERALQLARDEAVAASRAKSAFVANMSHEIRTPMNGIIGLTELLRRTELQARQRDYVEALHTAGQGLMALLNDVLDFSKIEAGSLQLESVDFSLVSVVEEVGQLVSVAAEAKGLELLAFCSPQLPSDVCGDPNRLRQVLLNLASNAVKFSTDGDVVVSAHLVERQGDELLVRCEVADHGIGIDPDQAGALFAPFTQADVSTTRKYGGTGLGLAISRQLVEAMGGRIGVDSSPGEGSTFWVELPLRTASSPVPHARHSPDSLRDVAVLVVDDNATNRMVLHDLLLAWGMRPTEAVDASSALEHLRAAAGAGDPFPVVLLDLCMPGTDGLELARTVTDDASIPPTDLLLLSSGPDLDPETVQRAGILARLPKPVRQSQLWQELARLGLRPSPDEPEAVHAAAPGARRGHVLVVEDNEINQIVAEGVLSALGYDCTVARDGRVALDLLATHLYDVVLMDCQMPELDGYEATSAFRAMEAPAGGRRTPVVAMTANATEEDRERCLAVGMDDYVSKPFGPEDLGRVLERWTSRSAAE